MFEEKALPPVSFKSGNESGSSVDETHASPHFRFVSKNFSAFVHCSSELNWILQQTNGKCWKQMISI